MRQFWLLLLLLCLSSRLSYQCKSNTSAKTNPTTTESTIKASPRVQLPREPAKAGHDRFLTLELEQREDKEEKKEEGGNEEEEGGKVVNELDANRRFLTLEEKARALGLEVGEEEEAMREREGRQQSFFEKEETGNGRGGEQEVDACFSLLRPGWQLYEAVVREKLNRADVKSCAGECKNRVYCRSFAFSESEFLGENCHLSELAEEGEEENQLKVERDATRDDMWGVYQVAEVCEEETLVPLDRGPSREASTAGCACNGFVDHTGGGECRSRDTSGRFWCYTSTESCPEATPDTFLPFLARTTQACTEGPCECNPFDFHQTGNLGVCMADVFDDSTFCYVSLESRCADKQPSKFFPSFHWSLAACAPRASQPPTSSNSLGEGQQEGGVVVEMHGLWNFTSTYTECRNYCSLAERCKSMYTHYDNELQLCHLSTRPFYPASYTHVHSVAQPRHTHLIQDEDVERLW